MSGVVELAEWLTDRDIPVIALTDNLRSEQNLMGCEAETADSHWSPQSCVLPEAQYFTDLSITEPLADIEGVHVIDMRDAYCIDSGCPTLIGNVHVYLDKNHVTTPYSQTVAAFFSQRAAEALEIG